jgi:integrase
MSGRNHRNSRTLPPRAVSGDRRKKLTRRRHQEGMLLKLKNGWAMRFYENCDGERRRMQKWLGDHKELPTRSAAKNVMGAELAVVNQTVTVAPRLTSITFRVAAKQWLQDCESRKLKPIKPSVAHNWRCILRNHLNDPIIGELLLEEVGNKAMRSLVDRLAKKGLAPATIKNICSVVKLVLKSVTDEEGNRTQLRDWNREFIDAPEVDEEQQHTPSFTSEQVTAILKAASGRLQMAAILFAASGLRAGELLGLECRHFDGTSVKVEQSVWGGNNRVNSPKTKNARRVVDLDPGVASLLREFIGERTSGFIFQTTTRKPVTQTNLLRRELHPLLESLGIPISGFHSFRRFRTTFLRQSRCPESLLRYWVGHSKKGITDTYDKSSADLAYRRDVCRVMGVGFELPKTLTAKLSKAGKTSESGLIGRSADNVQLEAIPC